MRFELSRHFQAPATLSTVFDVIERQFAIVSEQHYRGGGVVHAKKISPGSGSFLRSDATIVNAKADGDGFTVSTETEFGPSALFWLALLVGLLAEGIGILIPIALYFWQRAVVKKAIAFALTGVESELKAATSAVPMVPGFSQTDELVKLAALRDRGFLTQSEFDVQKQRLLR